MDLITLRAGGAGLVLAPEAGGSVARYRIERGGTAWELLRPWPAPRVDDVFGSAGFALVPYPWAFRATQHFVLSPGGLSVTVTVRNESDAPMPAGLGWHPYFPRTPRTTITADVQAMWLTDHEVMPTALAPPRPGADLSRGVLADAVALDNCFVGWNRRAAIEWPEPGLRLVMTAEAPLDFVVVYTPPGRPFFCAEPVSHVTDAFNLAGAGRTDTGMRALAPGETLRAVVTLAVEH